jgi:hypothetical protein
MAVHATLVNLNVFVFPANNFIHVWKENDFSVFLNQVVVIDFVLTILTKSSGQKGAGAVVGFRHF